MNLYWGDIHNHNELGYGSLERSYEYLSPGGATEELLRANSLIELQLARSTL